MAENDKQFRLNRRAFGKMLSLAGSAAAMGTVGGITRAAAADADWKAWIASYYGKPVKMAVTCYNTSNPYFLPTKVGAEDAGAQLGIDLQWTGVPDANTVNQIQQFQQLVNTGYEAIVVIPLEADAWIAPIKKATDAGVIVVTANSDSPQSARELFFGQDLVGAAIVQGEMLAKLAGGKGKVALTNCAPGLLALDLRVKGAKEGVTKGGLEVANVYNTNPADMAAELSTVKDILKANPDLAALMPLCGPDTAAAGQVRKEMGLKQPIVGTDLMYQTLELIKEGFIDGTVGQQPYLQGYLPVMYGYQRAILAAPKLELPDGNYFMANEIVTKDNVDTFLVREKRFPGMTETAGRVLLSARAISKRFGGVLALNDVTFNVRAGGVHGLIGANGAGKSTLIGVLSGAIMPDAGDLEVNGRQVPFGNVVEARKAGLAVVHQELMLFPDCTVEENIAATALPTRAAGFVDRRRRRAVVQRVLDSLGAAIDLSRRVSELPLPQRQLVEIGRALCGGGSIFVLDEPTSSLSAPEAAGLFGTIAAIAEEGAGVVFVSHRLDEVFAITQTITVLRDGHVEGNWPTDGVDVATITRAMVGDLANERPPRKEITGPIVLQARGAAGPGVVALDLDLRSGEVVGLAGLEGSGTSSALEMLGGIVPGVGGITVAGKAERFRHPADAIRVGVVYMPPDRKSGGLWLERSPLWNVAAAEVNRIGSFDWLRQSGLRKVGERRLDEVGVRAADRDQPVVRFSGGNQQRVMLARSIEMGPKVLLLNDFTRGVDVKAKAAIHALVRELADTGLAICLTSSDLDELLEVADRIICMRAGRQIASGPAAGFSELRLLSLVTTGAEASPREQTGANADNPGQPEAL